MPRTCTVCSHKLRLKIDKAIAFGKSNRIIATQFRLNPSSVQRHRKHAAKAIGRAAEKRELSIGEQVLERLESLYQRGLALLRKAERAKSYSACAAHMRELRHTLQTLYLVAVQTPQYSAQGKNVPDDELMKAISRALGVTGVLIPRHRPSASKLLPASTGDIIIDILPE